MADDFDRRLQRRLALLADAVPIPQFERGAPAERRRFGSVAWRGLPVGALGVIALILMVEVVLGFPARSTSSQQVASATSTAPSNVATTFGTTASAAASPTPNVTASPSLLPSLAVGPS